MESKVSVDNLLSRSLTIYLKRLPQIAVIAVIAYLPETIWSLWANSNVDPGIIELVSVPLSMLGGFIAQGAITIAAYRDMRDQGFQLGIGLNRAFAKILPLLGLSIATMVMVTLGSMLLLIPGIMLGCALFVSVPVLMVENRGIGDAISRSFELTAGYRWRIFLTGLVIGMGVLIPYAVVMFVIGMAFELATGSGSVVFTAMSSILGGIATSAISVFAVVTYFRLREDVDGVGLEDLEEVFA